MKLPQPGEILEGKYRLEQALGEGAFGLVVKATTLSTNRPVAVKLLKPAPGGYKDSRSQRFLRELRAIASLGCPNTLTLYDYGKTEAGILYMVTEYIEGEDLLELVKRRGRLSEQEVKHILRQVLLSLSEAHESSVLHRDIKPHNIRLHEYQGDPLCVKVLDFGLSKSLQDDEAAGLTAAGIAVGTPRYMSPEQLRGQELGPQTDIYSLGLVAYEMLLGKPAVPLDEMVGARRPIRLTSEDDVSPFMRELLNRMLAQQVKDRYATAAQVITALRTGSAAPAEPETQSSVDANYRRGLPPATRSGELPRAASREFSISKNALIGMVAAFVLLTAGALLMLWPDPAPETVVPTSKRNLMGAAQSPSDRGEPDAVPVKAAEPESVDLGTPVADVASGCAGKTAYQPGIQPIARIETLTRQEVLTLIPPGYDPHKLHPLVWMYHDADQHPQKMLELIDLESVADMEPFIVIAARSTLPGIFAWSKRHDWESSLTGLEIAMEELCIDPDRVNVVGHGVGGTAGIFAMCSKGVAAVATTSHLVRAHELRGCNPENPPPYLFIVSDNDPAEPLAGGANCAGVGVFPLSKQRDLFKTRNHCRGEQRPWKRGPDGCATWNCETPFVSCVADGGRQWAGDKTKWMMCQSGATDFPFTRTLWQFFSEISDKAR